MSLSEKFKKLKEQKEKETVSEPKKVLPVKNIKIEKIESKKPEKSILNEDIIDFNVLANSSDFKRVIYRALMGKVWRGTNSGLEISLKSKLKKLNGSGK